MSVKPPAKPATPIIKNSAAAPVVFFDNALAFGHMNGIVEVELAARLLVPRSDDSVGVEIASVAHLRASIAAAVSLRDALDKVLKMAAEPAIKLAS